MAFEKEIAEYNELLAKYKDSIPRDEMFAKLYHMVTILFATYTSMAPLFFEFVGLISIAYCIGRERGRKESAMKAMLGG